MSAHLKDQTLLLTAAVLDESDHPFLIADRSGRLLYANESACKTLRLSGSWSPAAPVIEHEILGSKLDGILLGLESGGSSVELDLEHGGSCIAARMRLLPHSDWLLIRLCTDAHHEETDIDIRSSLSHEASSRAANLEAADATLEKAALEGSDTICEALGDGLYFLACTPEMKRIRKQTFQIAAANVPVLITGESGSGKEVVARMIHNHRKQGGNGHFVKVNCAAVPAELLESELFGYEQGAFTGAVRAKPGKFELADNGTIFLDEIVEMNTHLQSKLLHVLQDGRFSRLGSRHMVQVHVRVIAAMNVDVHEAIRQGRFREDLYYRLNVVPCHLPPLRERVAEIPILLRLFFERYCREFGKQLAPPAPVLMDAAQRHPWPGNVRELENFVKRYVVLADEEESLRELLEMEASRARETETNGNTHNPQTLKSLVRGLKDEAEMQAIADVLKQTHWRRKEAARILGISYKALLYKMRQFGFSPSRDSNGHHTQERVI